MAAEYRVWEVATTQHYDADGTLACDAGTVRPADLSRLLPAGWKHVVLWARDEPEPQPAAKSLDDAGTAADQPAAPSRRGRSAS